MTHTEEPHEPRGAERTWIDWTKATYPSDHIGAALAQLDRIATALEGILNRTKETL